MKCPNCGGETGGNAKFCGSCGCKIETRPGNTAGRIIAAVLKVIACAVIMSLCQGCVMINYETVLISEKLPQGIAADAAEFQEQLGVIINEVTGTALSHVSMIELIGGLLTILVLFLAMRLRKKKPLGEFGFRFVGPGRVIGFLIFGVALNVFISGTISLLPFRAETMTEYESSVSILMTAESLPLRILALAVITPLVEEIVFRGFAMTRLKPVMGRIPAIIVSALIFGAAHYSFVPASLISVAYAFILGLVLAYSFDRYDSVIPGICCHMGFNAMSFLETDSKTLGTVMYVASVILIVMMAVRLYVNYPDFSDVLYSPDRFEGKTDRERALIAKMRRLREADTPPETGEIESLAKEWDEIHGKKKGTGSQSPLKDEKTEDVPEEKETDENGDGKDDTL